MARAWHAFAVYVVAALVGTWPLVRGLGRDVPWDLGDSILNMWILSWDCEQIRRILCGDFSRIATFFDGNIFYPASAVARLLGTPDPSGDPDLSRVGLISGNPILCYNLLFLSTIVLSGLGMYLLVRELTGNAMAAFVAGLLFAFAPYRLPQSGHLQVLTSQWMPFVMYGVLRYCQHPPVAAAGRRCQCPRRPEPVVGLLPALLHAVRRAVRALACLAGGSVARASSVVGRWRLQDCWSRLSPRRFFCRTRHCVVMGSRPGRLPKCSASPPMSTRTELRLVNSSCGGLGCRLSPSPKESCFPA